jgi:hypothetical protein
MENYTNFKSLFDVASKNMMANFKRDVQQFLIGMDIDTIEVFDGGDGVALLKWRGQVRPLAEVYYRIANHGGDLTFEQFNT